VFQSTISSDLCTTVVVGGAVQWRRRRVEFQISGLTGKVYQILCVVTSSIWVFIVIYIYTHITVVYFTLRYLHADLFATWWKTILKIPKQTRAPDSGGLLLIYILIKYLYGVMCVEDNILYCIDITYLY